MSEGRPGTPPGEGAASPTPLEHRRADLARRLRDLRRAAGLDQKALATRLGVTQGRVSQIETARYALTRDTLDRLMDALEVDDASRAELGDMLSVLDTEVLSLRLATRRGHRANQARVGAAEAAATAIDSYQVMIIPGLLQTAAYARHMLAILLPELSDVEDLIAGRLERQRVLYDDNKRFRFLVYEGALRAQVTPPTVMRGQLDRLLTLSTALHHVELRVLPVGPVPLHGWSLTSFDLVDDEYVWLEHLTGEVITHDPPQVAVYRARFDGLWQSALGGEAMTTLVREIDQIFARLDQGQSGSDLGR